MSARFPRIIPGSACFYNGSTVAKPNRRWECPVLLKIGWDLFVRLDTGKADPERRIRARGRKRLLFRRIRADISRYANWDSAGCRRRADQRIRRRKGLVFDARSEEHT